MAVTSTTLAGVNVWQFSGAVTDAQIQTAWSALVANGVYTINRAIYLDSTADLTGCTGGFLVNFGTQVSPAIILHTARDKTKSTFNNFTFLQSVGLSVGSRGTMVKTWNGTTLVDQGGGIGADGIAQKGGGFVYGVAGNPGGGDPRYLNEIAFAGLEGVTIFSQEFTEQELQPCVGATTIMKGLTFEKCFGFPQIGTATANTNVVVYRSTENTQHATQYPVRIYPVSNRYGAVCYVDSYTTRNNADITTRLGDFYGSNASNPCVVMILNNYTRESWFGASKTAFSMGNWYAGNQVIGGALKKLQFVNGNGGIVRCYDSRSTTVAQKCAFAESGFIDFVNTNLAPTTDSTGKISLVHVGAIATGGSASITRYTNQKYTFQKFGYRVLVGTPDMTAGDNDLSAYNPITITVQDGITRTQSEITAATTINTFQDLLEELHVLSIGLVGAQSYSGAFNGNLFNYDGSVLTTSFTTVNVDATAASKISYNSTTNTLTIKSSVLTDNSIVTKWNNSAGTINLLNSAVIQGVYQTSSGTSTIWEFGATAEPIIAGTSLAIYDSTGTTKYYNAVTTDGVYRYYIAPQSTGATYTYAIERYGYRREEGTFPSNAGGILFYVPSYGEDVGITESTLATVQAYTTLSDTAEIYDATANFRLSETGIKLGQLVARDGTFLDFGNFNVKIKDDASAIVGVASGTITYKSIVINESLKYNAMKATPPKTITPTDTEIINVLIEDANGDSQINILGGLAPFNIYKFPIATTDFPVGLVPDTRTDVANFVESTSERNYRFIADPDYNYFVFSPSGRSDANIPNNFEGQTDWEVLAKGIYEAPLFKGQEIIILEAPEITQINQKMDEVIVKVDNNLDVKVSTRLATADYVAPHNDEIDAIKLKVDTLDNTDLTGIATATDVTDAKDEIIAELANIDVDLTGIATSQNVTDAKDEIIAELANIDVDLTGVALEATSQSIITKVDAIQTTVDNIDVDFTPVLDAVATKPTLTEIEESTILANKTDIENAKDSIETKIDNIVVDNEAISAQVWADEPERLKQVATVETTGSQIASFNNL